MKNMASFFDQEQIPSTRQIDYAKRDFKRVGISLLLLLILPVFMKAFTVGFLLIIRYFSGKADFVAINFQTVMLEVQKMTKDVLPSYSLEFLVSTLISFIFPFMIMSRQFGFRLKGYLKKPKLSPRIILASCFFLIGLKYVSTSLMLGINQLFLLPDINLTPQDFGYLFSSVPETIIMLFTVAFVAPLTEEIIYRGIVLSVFARYGKWFAVIASSTLWALSHGNFSQSIPSFIVGIFLGLLAFKAKSIRPTIIAHVSNNLLSCIINIIAVQNPILATKLDVVFRIGFILIGLILLTAFSKEFRFTKEEKELNDQSASIKPYRTLFLSWPVLIFTAVSISQHILFLAMLLNL